VFGLPVKVNAVIRRGWNDGEILPLVRWARHIGVTLRFIEYMDVGETNGWKMEEVVSASEILDRVQSEFSLTALPPTHSGETALRFRHADGLGEIGIIASVTRPFCGDCSRLRLSAEGKLFTCLFASSGHDLRALLRGGADDATLSSSLGSIWSDRSDRYSELRGRLDLPGQKAEMSYLGG
jgi:cyclic pyranopterin phosphate synthase